jgi:hypothetical protein
MQQLNSPCGSVLCSLMCLSTFQQLLCLQTSFTDEKPIVYVDLAVHVRIVVLIYPLSWSVWHWHPSIPLSFWWTMATFSTTAGHSVCVYGQS